MFFGSLGKYNIIQVNNNPFQMHVPKQSLESSWCIGEAKGYVLTLIKPNGPTVNAVSALLSSSNSTCQYHDLRSNDMNHWAPFRQSNVSSILGREYASFTVLEFNFLRSMQNLREPSSSPELLLRPMGFYFH